MKNIKRSVLITGPMPPFHVLATSIWGEFIDYDSDGDSKYPDSTDWRELTIRTRPDYLERVDIDPVEGQRDQVIINTTSESLMKKVLQVLINKGSIET